MPVCGSKLGNLEKGKQPAVKKAFDDALALLERVQGGFQQSHLKKWIGGQASQKEAETGTG